MKAIHTKIRLSLLLVTTVAACSKEKEPATNTPEAYGAMPAVTDKVEATDAQGTQLTEVVQDNSGKKVLYWYDPMVADKHFDKPGKSPFMDMQLVPKYAEDDKP